MKINKQKLSLILIIALFLLVSGIFFVRAEDDDEEDGDSNQADTQQYITKTIVVEPAKTIYEKVIRNIEFSDTDHDGLINEEDPHPSVAEIYVVKDDNQNGIVDEFENSK